MWALVNRTTYAADRTWVRDRDGRHLWIVAIKASFVFDAAGRLRPAEEQTPPLPAPEWRGEPGLSSLSHEAELTAPTLTTDVLVHGAAYAPGGRAARVVEVGLRVAGLEKRLRVHGPRVYRARALGGYAPGEAEPFVRQELSYELAYGGMDLTPRDPADQRIDSRNPVGRGVVGRGRTLRDQPAHQIEYADGSPRPAGFGPIASHWSPRLERQGTYDEAWSRGRRPLLPHDYDPAALQAAPDDQRPAQHLRGGEPVTLLNLTPAGVVTVRLPTLRFAVTTSIGALRRPQPVVLSRVVIEPELPRLSLVWSSSLEVGPRSLDDLDLSTVEELS